MKVPNGEAEPGTLALSLSRLQNEGSQLNTLANWRNGKSIKATE